MNGINTNFGSIRLYSGKSNASSYVNDGTFVSLISESQKTTENNETTFDFSGMYIRTHQISAEEAAKDPYGTSVSWKNTDYLQVPIAGDLKELMESIEKGLADGESLKSILQNRIDRYAKERGEEGLVAVGTIDADIILIDPETGKVINSLPKDRVIVLSQKIQDTDYDTVRSQADDLATFLRYAVFKKETDDPEKVSALLSELKDKQSGYDTSRFLPIFYSGGKQGIKNLEYWLNLLGTDWGNSLSEDERNDAADELLKILEKRNSSKADEDNNLQEVIDQMKAENIGKSNVTKTVLHNALFKMY